MLEHCMRLLDGMQGFDGEQATAGIKAAARALLMLAPCRCAVRRSPAAERTCMRHHRVCCTLPGSRRAQVCPCAWAAIWGPNALLSTAALPMPCAAASASISAEHTSQVWGAV